MNGKQAKRLRRLAETMAVGKPTHDRRYYAPAGHSFLHRPRVLTWKERVAKMFGRKVQETEVDARYIVDSIEGTKKRSPICQHPDSLRSIYRRLKVAYKRGATI